MRKLEQSEKSKQDLNTKNAENECKDKLVGSKFSEEDIEESIATSSEIKASEPSCDLGEAGALDSPSVDKPKRSKKKRKKKPPKNQYSDECHLKGHDHKFKDCPNPKSEHYCAVHYWVLRDKERAEEGEVDEINVNNEAVEKELVSDDHDGANELSGNQPMKSSTDLEPDFDKSWQLKTERSASPVSRFINLGQSEEVGDFILNDMRTSECKFKTSDNEKAEHHHADVDVDETQTRDRPKIRSKKRKKKPSKKQHLDECHLKGHDHKFADCPNNPKSTGYCGVHYSVIRQQERAKENEDKDNTGISKVVNESGCDGPISNQVATTSAKVLGPNSDNTSQLKDDHLAIPDSVDVTEEQTDEGDVKIKYARKYVSSEFALIKADSSVQASGNLPPSTKSVYVSSGVMSNMLKQRLICVNVNKNDLPMDISNFYEKYIISSDIDLDVRHSSYHNLHSWLEAMQDEGLVVLTKTWQTGRKFRKCATSKSVIAVGREQVLKYNNRSKPGNNIDVAKEDSQEEIVVPHRDEIKEFHPSNKDQTSNSKDDMDYKLSAHILNLEIHQEDLPMGIGNFYSKYIKSEDLDVQKSSYRTVSKWMIAMEKDGHVLLKKQSRSKSAPFVVVAFGEPRVKIMKRIQEAPTNCASVTDNTVTESCQSSDAISDGHYDHIDMKRTIHAKQRQQARDISDNQLKRTIEKSKTPIKRGRDGVKTISTDGVTAVVACGQKKKVITTWKEDENAGDYLERWSQSNPVALSSEFKVRSGKQIVTISETYQRHQQPGKRGTRGEPWIQGDLVTKHKKHRKNFLVVGLSDDIVNSVKTQLQNQMGCHVSTGTLNMDSWILIHGAEIGPLAKEGSKTIAFNLAADADLISRALGVIEQHVRSECRRYLREERECDLFFIREVGLATDTSIMNEATARKVYGEIMRLFKQHNPERSSTVPELWAKYRGREIALLNAIKREYCHPEKLGQDLFYARFYDVRSKCSTKKVNVEDLL